MERSIETTGADWLGSAPRAFIRAAVLLLLASFAFVPASAPASAMTLVKIETGKPGAATFLMEGSFVSGDVERLRKALVKLPPGTAAAVIFNSPGGNLIEGINLGALIYESRLATFVKGDGGSCHSACSLAFLAGRNPRTGQPMRVKPTRGDLGFHQFRRSEYDALKVYTKADFEAEVTHAQEISKIIVRYLKYIGEDLTKLQLMLRAPTEGMNILSDDECLKRGISVLDEETGRLHEPGTAAQRMSSL